MLLHKIWKILGLIVLSKNSLAAVVSGTQGGFDKTTGYRPFRLEINQFQYSGPAFDLYIQALQQFMDMDESDPLSYYQVAGIHGYPNKGYGGVMNPTGSAVGFCEHFSILFLSWHRPYLVFFEGVLWTLARSIAQQYPLDERDTYQDAAETLRIPYWDWSLNATMPDAATKAVVTIKTPTGFADVNNPLYSYKFHPVIQSDFPHRIISQYPWTVRSPVQGTFNSNEDSSNAVLQKNAAFFHDSIYSLFSSETDYQPFSNAGDRPGGWNSLENVHNAVHQWVGGFGGHMTYIPYGSFDPLFWLHHANVDRIFAMWQALNPDSYVVPQVNQVGTFTVKAGTVEDENTPLYPFYADDKGNFHTPKTVRSIKSFGYTYPELVDWAIEDAQLATNIRRIVNFLYHPSPTSKRSFSSRTNKAPIGAALAADKQWVLNIKVKRLRLPDSLSIHFFMSTPPPSPSAWSTAPSLIGSQPVPIPSGSPSQAILVGSIQLTHSLLHLPSLDERTVLKHVKTNLYWKAQLRNGSEHDAITSMKDTAQVEIMTRSVEQTAKDDEFPIYGKWKGYGAVKLGANGRKVF